MNHARRTAETCRQDSAKYTRHHNANHNKATRVRTEHEEQNTNTHQNRQNEVLIHSATRLQLQGESQVIIIHSSTRLSARQVHLLSGRYDTK